MDTETRIPLRSPSRRVLRANAKLLLQPLLCLAGLWAFDPGAAVCTAIVVALAVWQQDEVDEIRQSDAQAQPRA